MNFTFDRISAGPERGCAYWIPEGVARSLEASLYASCLLDVRQDTIATDPHQTIWTLDLATRAAVPVHGLPAFGGQPNVFTIDGRTFVLLPSSDYGSTSIYELPSDGSAVQRAKATGWVYQMFKI